MIVITGMHRSGTSFTTNLAMKIGLDLGPENKLLGDDKWNKKGYFENIEVLDLNNRILLGDGITGQYWILKYHERSILNKAYMAFQKSKYLIFPSQNSYGGRASAKSDEICTLSEKYDEIAVKDPRFSLLIAYWYEYGKVDKILYCFRNPYEVAKSLKDREKLPIWLGYKMWLYHVNIFLKQIQDIRPLICFINFNNFFTNERRLDEIERLYHFIGKKFDGDDASGIIDNILDETLQHNIFSEQRMPERVERLYNLLLEYHKIYDKPFCFTHKCASNNRLASSSP